MVDRQEQVDAYVASWNESDVDKWWPLIVQTWAEDGRYVAESSDGAGHSAINTIRMFAWWITNLSTSRCSPPTATSISVVASPAGVMPSVCQMRVVRNNTYHPVFF